MVTSGWGLVVLAAGVASRYGAGRIKQLDPVGPTGEVLSDYALRDALAVGASHAVFVIRAELEPLFRDHHVRWQGRVRLRYVHQPIPAGRNKPWGTTEAVVLACDPEREPVLVLNADDYYGPEAIRVGAEWLARRRRASVGLPAAANIAFRLGDTLSPHGGVSRALLEHDERGRLVRIRETHELRAASLPAAARETLVSMNCWALTPAVTPLLRTRLHHYLDTHEADADGECRLPETIMELVDAGLLEVTVVHAGRGWLGMTHAADRDSVVRALRAIPPCN